MKHTIIALFVIAIFSNAGCANRDRATEKAVEVETEMKDTAEGWVTGTITTSYADEGCGVMIQLDVTDASLGLLNPATLDEKFQKDGMRVRLKFQRTRMPQPNECNKGMLVIINEIEKL